MQNYTINTGQKTLPNLPSANSKNAPNYTRPTAATTRRVRQEETPRKSTSRYLLTNQPNQNTPVPTPRKSIAKKEQTNENYNNNL